MISKLYNFLYKFNNNVFVYRLIKLFLNLCYPIYIQISSRRSLDLNSNIVISLTSFPARIESLHLVIETLMRQSQPPYKIILWLSKEQFLSEDNLPEKILNLKKHGLDIVFCDGDMKSHKKYFYAMQRYPNHSILTVDDDTFYPENLVENLNNAAKQNPSIIYSNVAHQITFDKSGNVNSYINWISGGGKNLGPSHLLVPIGCGGVLYPPQCMYSDIYDKDLISNLCPLADDLWLKAMAIMNGVQAKKVHPKVITYATILNTTSSSLNKVNVSQNYNDVQFQKILDHYPEILKILSEEARL